MLSLFIGFLTVVLVLDCLLLILLVLVQLPKKEAGMGQAFGGAATDALFGAGSGNALTKVTKWGAGVFFALAIVLTIMGNFATSKRGGTRLQELINQTPAATLPATPPATTTATPPPANPAIQLNAPAGQTPPPTTTTPAPAPGNK